MGNTCLNSEQLTKELPKNIFSNEQRSQFELTSNSNEKTFLHLPEFIGTVKFQLNTNTTTPFKQAKAFLIGERIILTPAHSLVNYADNCNNIWFFLKLVGSIGKEQKAKVIKHKICPQYLKSNTPENDYAIGLLDRKISIKNYLSLQNFDPTVVNYMNSKENNHLVSFPTTESYQCVLKERCVNAQEGQIQQNKLSKQEGLPIIAKSLKGQCFGLNYEESNDGHIHGCLFNEDVIKSIKKWASQFQELSIDKVSINQSSSKNLKSRKLILSLKQIQDKQNYNREDKESQISLFWAKYDQIHSQVAFNSTVEALFKVLDAQKSKRELSRPLIDIMSKIGEELRNSQEHQKSLYFYQQSYDAWELLKLQKDSQYAQILFWIGVNLSQLGNYDQALKFFSEQLKILDQKGDYGTKIYTSTVNNIGYINCLKGNYQNSIKLFAEAVDLRKKLVRGKDSLLAGYINNLGSAYFHSHNYHIAKCKIISALQMWKQMGEAQTLEVATAYYRLAVIYFEQKLFEKALQLVQSSIRIGKKHRTPFKLAEKLVEFKNMILKISEECCLSQEIKELILQILSDFYNSEEVQKVKKLWDRRKN